MESAVVALMRARPEDVKTVLRQERDDYLNALDKRTEGKWAGPRVRATCFHPAKEPTSPL